MALCICASHSQLDKELSSHENLGHHTRCPLWYFPHSYFQHPFISDSSSLKISVPLNISSFCSLHKYMRLDPSSGHMYQESEGERKQQWNFTHSDHWGPFPLFLWPTRRLSTSVLGSSLPARPPYAQQCGSMTETSLQLNLGDKRMGKNRETHPRIVCVQSISICILPFIVFQSAQVVVFYTLTRVS